MICGASAFVTQVIIPTILIVYLGMLSSFLSAKDYAGDRAALLGVSILICMVNLERDHGLGKLMYSTYFDVFNLVQVIVQAYTPPPATNFGQHVCVSPRSCTVVAVSAVMCAAECPWCGVDAHRSHRADRSH